MNKNIILTGFMGTGKSLVSIHLAKRLNRKRISTDELIEKKDGRPIREIFQDSGEEYFRQIEAETVHRAAQSSETVIDCGGGVVINPENLKRLKQNGIVFCLTASPEMIFKRVQGRKHRPLLNTDDPQLKIKELLEERQPYYQQADFIIETTNRTVEQTADEIMGLFKKGV